MQKQSGLGRDTSRDTQTKETPIRQVVPLEADTSMLNSTTISKLTQELQKNPLIRDRNRKKRLVT